MYFYGFHNKQYSKPSQTLQKQKQPIGPICLFLFLFPFLQKVGQKGSCCDLCHRVFCLCFPLRVLYMESKKKKNGSEEPRGRTGIKMETQRMDLRTRGGGRVSWDEVREWYGHIYSTRCKIDSQWEAAVQHREISSVLCDHLEGWDREGGMETQEGGDMGIYVQLIHFVIKQKLTHHCKAIILQ